MSPPARRGQKRAALLWLALEFVAFILAGFVRVVAAEDAVDIRPAWLPLEGHGDAVAEVFRSSEVLQIYHLQVRACGVL